MVLLSLQPLTSSTGTTDCFPREPQNEMKSARRGTRVGSRPHDTGCRDAFASSLWISLIALLLRLSSRGVRLLPAPLARDALARPPLLCRRSGVSVSPCLSCSGPKDVRRNYSWGRNQIRLRQESGCQGEGSAKSMTWTTSPHAFTFSTPWGESIRWPLSELPLQCSHLGEQLGLGIERLLCGLQDELQLPLRDQHELFPIDCSRRRRYCCGAGSLRLRVRTRVVGSVTVLHDTRFMPSASLSLTASNTL
jgi:hypothetical protein